MEKLPATCASTKAESDPESCELGWGGLSKRDLVSTVQDASIVAEQLYCTSLISDFMGIFDIDVVDVEDLGSWRDRR